MVRSPESTGRSPERGGAEADGPSLDRVEPRRSGREVIVGGTRVQISDDGDFRWRIKEAANGTDVSTVDESSPAPTDEGFPILFGYDAQTAPHPAIPVGPEVSAARRVQPDGGSRSADVMESRGAVQKISFYDCDRWNALGTIRSIRIGGGPVIQVDTDPVGVCGDDDYDAMVHREGGDRPPPSGRNDVRRPFGGFSDRGSDPGSD